MSNKLSFGEELLLDEECTLGETDEVALFLCFLCGLGAVAACIACGCEIPIAFGLGSSFGAQYAGMTFAAGAATPM